MERDPEQPAVPGRVGRHGGPHARSGIGVAVEQHHPPGPLEIEQSSIGREAERDREGEAGVHGRDRVARWNGARGVGSAEGDQRDQRDRTSECACPEMSSWCDPSGWRGVRTIVAREPPETSETGARALPRSYPGRRDPSHLAPGHGARGRAVARFGPALPDRAGDRAGRRRAAGRHQVTPGLGRSCPRSVTPRASRSWIPTPGRRWMFDATPDFREQLHRLDRL